MNISHGGGMTAEQIGNPHQFSNLAKHGIKKLNKYTQKAIRDILREYMKVGFLTTPKLCLIWIKYIEDAYVLCVAIKLIMRRELYSTVHAMNVIQVTRFEVTTDRTWYATNDSRQNDSAALSNHGVSPSVAGSTGNEYCYKDWPDMDYQR